MYDVFEALRPCAALQTLQSAVMPMSALYCINPCDPYGGRMLRPMPVPVWRFDRLVFFYLFNENTGHRYHEKYLNTCGGR